MDKEQLYSLGMHFLYGVRKMKYTYILFYDRHQYRESFSQPIVIEKNYKKAFNHLKKAANNNHPEALFELGIMYHCGYGVEKSIEQGEKCFDSSVKTNLDYMGRIATPYHAQSEMQNFDKVLELYTHLEKRLGESLYKSGQVMNERRFYFGRGLLHEFGDSVKQSYPMAFEYYKKSADSNRSECDHRLALMYYYGKGVPVDYRKALDLFINSTYGEVQFIYLPYVHYQIGSDKNIPQKSLVYRIIHEREILGESYYYLGLMHKHGQGVVKDEEIARDCFQEAAKRGYKRANYEL